MQFHYFLKNILFPIRHLFLFIHRSCITQGNIVLKVVNSRCLEKGENGRAAATAVADARVSILLQPRDRTVKNPE